MAVLRYTNDELISMIKQNDHTAFAYVYQSYSPLLLRLIGRMGIDTQNAHTILEQVFLDTWNGVAKLELTGTALYLWMHRNTQLAADNFLYIITENIPMPALQYDLKTALI